jgi:hypothetical protein
MQLPERVPALDRGIKEEVINDDTLYRQKTHPPEALAIGGHVQWP